VKRIALYILLLWTGNAGILAQCIPTDIHIEGVEDSLQISFDLVYHNDTIIISQLLIVSTESKAPLYLYQDTLALKSGINTRIKHQFAYSSIIDTSAFYSLYISKYLKPKKLTAYSNLQPGHALFIVNSIPHQSPKTCTIESDSSGHFLMNPFSNSINSDSLVLELLSTDNSHSLFVECMNADSISLEQAIIVAKNKDWKSLKINIHSSGTEICRSAIFNLRRIETPEIKPIDKPTFKNIDSACNTLNSDSYKDLKKAFIPPFISGTLLSETNIQNFQYAYTDRNPSFSRLYMNAALNPFGIPFSFNGFITTEQNAERKLNYFKLEFDQRRWEENKKKRLAFMEQYLQSQKNDLEGKTKTLENQLYTQRKSLENLSNLHPEWKGLNIPDSLQNIHPKNLDLRLDTLDDLPKTPGLQDSIHSDNLSDSVNQAKQQWLDTMNMLNSKIQHIQNGINQLKSLRNKISGMENQIDQLKKQNNPLDNIKRFQIGDFYPQFSPFTIEGTQIRGAGGMYQVGNLSVEAFYGKGVVPRNTNFIDTSRNQEYTRKSSGMSLEYHKNPVYKGKFFFLYFQDGKDLSEVNRAGNIKNSVLGYSHFYQATESLTLTGELAYSTLNFLSLPDSFEKSSTNRTGYGAFADNSAIELKGNWSHSRTRFEIELGVKRIGPNFYSSGVPYLRKNYQELSIQLKKKLIKDKIKVSINYTLNENNLDKLQGYNTRMQGFGFQANSLFKKGPNFMLSYLPFRTVSEFQATEFQQNPSIANPVYRNVVQNNVFIFMAMHQTEIFSQSLNFNLNYTRTNITLNETTNRVQMITMQALGAYKSSINYGLNLGVNFQSPETLDSNRQTHGTLFFEQSFKKFKLRNGIDFAQIGSYKKLMNQLISVKSQFYGIQWEMGLNIAWVNEQFYPSYNNTPVTFQSQIHYSF